MSAWSVYAYLAFGNPAEPTGLISGSNDDFAQSDFLSS